VLDGYADPGGIRLVQDEIQGSTAMWGSGKLQHLVNPDMPWNEEIRGIAQLVQITTDPLEQFAAGLGGKVSRRPLDEVLAELEAQDEAAREADQAARKAIREQKKRERKEDFQTRVDALKAKFHKD
jgi:hypothetical protein